MQLARSVAYDVLEVTALCVFLAMIGCVAVALGS
jgi:hypothetical protein